MGGEGDRRLCPQQGTAGKLRRCGQGEHRPSARQDRSWGAWGVSLGKASPEAKGHTDQRQGWGKGSWEPRRDLASAPAQRGGGWEEVTAG